MEFYQKMKTNNQSNSPHLDAIGQEIRFNDVVAFWQSNSIKIGRVIKLHPKMIRLKELKKSKHSWNTGEYNKYPADTVIIDGEQAMIYILKNS